MATLKSASLQFACSSSSSSFSHSCSTKRTIRATINVPKHRKFDLSVSKLPNINLVDEFTSTSTSTIPPTKKDNTSLIMHNNDEPHSGPFDTAATIAKLYVIIDAISDRVEMHANLGDQRDNWNTLLLNSLNMITLTATTMAALGSTGTTMPLSPLKLSSTLLFCAATGILVVMNKIQPSQLAEEQRSASRLFKNLLGQVKNLLDLRAPTQSDVDLMMEKVLALDKAYPLPILGVMLEKFPKSFDSAVWWPSNQFQRGRKLGESKKFNGWSEQIEMEMREIVEVLKRKDIEDYMRLGKLVLKINKVLAISGPILTGIAALGSAFSGSYGSLVAVLAGALATTINTFEHGCQVGMVFEMYRNNAGFFRLLEESIGSTLEENVDERENGELFEMKVALQLGRSLSELRELADSSANSSRKDENSIVEFASKIF